MKKTFAILFILNSISPLLAQNQDSTSWQSNSWQSGTPQDSISTHMVFKGDEYSFKGDSFKIIRYYPDKSNAFRSMSIARNQEGRIFHVHEYFEDLNIQEGQPDSVCYTFYKNTPYLKSIRCLKNDKPTVFYGFYRNGNISEYYIIDSNGFIFQGYRYYNSIPKRTSFDATLKRYFEPFLDESYWILFGWHNEVFSELFMMIEELEESDIYAVCENGEFKVYYNYDNLSIQSIGNVTFNFDENRLQPIGVWKFYKKNGTLKKETNDKIYW
ncbi:MAG: hypothetical protein O3C22_06955 [Bacteroidetes bacterium]|nr:hypothetical protein [Bacteroidota bacterium]MDA0943970.1 hypothetical protein [Bacteroidota bacterium]MDA1112158.1 hypothetical protein [Bacteroidota bacterium]